MKVRLRNTLAIAGLLSIMTFQTANAQDVGSYTDLLAAIQSATGDGTINLTGNITAPDGAAALGSLGQTPVTINGGGFTLDGNGADGLTIGSGQELTLTNFEDIMWFNNPNDASAGSAAFNRGTLTIEGGKFSNNSAANIAGAVYNVGELTITGTEFNSNSSDWEGGAIYNWAEATISGATFTGNTAGSYGGAIYNEETLTVGSTAFNTNSTTESGGAIFNNYDLTLNDGVTFTGNTASEYGGALYNEDGATSTIETNNIFSTNHADVAGGAIYNSGEMTIGDGAQFTSNSAVQGGALFHNADTELLLNLATFTSNKATGNPTEAAGGALAIGKDVTQQVHITNSEFGQNNSGVAGGAIFQVDGSTATITVESTTFDRNYTGAEGGAIVSDSILNITGSTFTGNQTTSTKVGSNYQDTDEGGGAIFLYDNGVANIQNSTFEGNHSGTFGGAIGTRSTSAVTPTSSLTISGSTFTDNTAGVKGGAISTFVATEITGSNFTENSATQQGGAIWANKDTTINSVASGVVFSGNSAAQGGAIYNNALLTLNSTDGNITFSGNTATNGGASVYLNGTGSGLAVNGTAGKVSFQDNGAVAGNGNITKDGTGTLEFVGNKDVSKFSGQYTQENGILNLSNSTMFNKYNIKLGEFNLTGSSSAVADGVDRVINDAAGVTVSLADGAGLDVTGGTLGQNNKLALNNGGRLNVSGIGDVYFKGDSVWEGNVNNQNGGSVILDGFTHSTADGAGNYTQTGGDLTLQNGSELTIGNTASSISGGTVEVQSGNTLNVGGGGTLSGSQSTTVAGTLNVNNGGKITGGTTAVDNGGALNVNNGGAITSGTTNVNDGGKLSVNNGGSISGGTANVNNGGVVDVNNGGSISSGTTNVNSGANLNVNDGGKITGGTTNVKDGGTVTIATGGSISGNANTTIQSGGNVTVNGGTLNTSNGKGVTDVQKGGTLAITSGGQVTLDSNDKWAGKISNDSSTLTLNGVTHNTQNGAYEQTSGTLNLENNSNLTLGTNGTISDGSVNVTNSSFVVGDGGKVEGGSVTVKEGSSFEIQKGGSVTGGTIDFDAKNLTIQVSGDVLAEAVFEITEGNKVVINAPANVTLNKDTTTGEEWLGTVQLNGGTLNFTGTNNNTNGQFLGDKGNLNIQSDSQHFVVAADDYIKGDVVTNIASGSYLDVAGGDVELNAKDVWNGTVSISDGTLLLSNASKTTDGVLTQTNGETTVTGASFVLNNTSDSISGGDLNIGTDKAAGTLTQQAGTISADAQVNINNGTLAIQGGTTTLDKTDNWNGTVELSKDGALTLNGIENDNGKLVATDGTLTLSNTELLVENGSTIGKDVDLTFGTGSSMNIQNNGSVSFDDGSEWGGAVNLNGGIFNFMGTKNGTNGQFHGDKGNLNIEGSQHFVVAADDYIKGNVITNIASGSYLDVAGGNVELNAKDVWKGTVSVSDGNLLLSSGASKNKEGILTQTDGVTTVTGNSFVLNNASDSISGGDLNIGTDKVAGTLTQQAGTISADAQVNINNGTLAIQGGTTTLDKDDKWKGTVQLSKDGALTLNGIENDNGKLVATDGALTLSDTELLVENGSTIGKDVDVTFGADSSMNIQNNGSVSFDKDSEWGGDVNLNGGSLNYSAAQNGALTAVNGTLNTTSGSTLTIDTGSYIENAVNANIQGQLNISGTDADNGGYVTLGSGDTLLGNTTLDNYGVLNLGDDVEMADRGQTITFNGADAVMNLETNNHLNLKAELVGTDGQINKNGAGDVKFSGGTSQYQGNLLVNNSGDLTFVDEEGFGGNLEFGNVEGKEIGIIADKIHGAITQDVDAKITYAPYRDIDLNFNDSVSVLKGELVAKTNYGKDVNFNSTVDVKDNTSLTVNSGRNINFNDAVNIIGGTIPQDYAKVSLSGWTINSANDFNAENSLIYANAKNTAFNNLSLTDSTLQIAQNGFAAENLFISGNSNVQLMNGTITDNNVGNLKLDDAGVGNFTIDISPRDWTSDKILAGAITANGAGGTLNVSDFQFLNKCPIDRHVPLQIFDSSRPGYENIVFSATNKEIFTPIGYYGLFPSAAGNGSYTASLTRYNPQVYRGQVATMSTWQNQLTIDNLLFDHVQEINMQYLSQSNPNKYAAAYPQFAPYQYNKKDGSIWFKPFGVIEKLNMTQGLNVNNTFYGALIGADFPAVELKRGWTLLPTAYVGYTGAHQSFNGVGMYQNGGQAGAMATFMKKDFIGSILAFGGGYSNRMDVAGYTDDTGNWIAGTAAKAAYNFHPTKHFIIQPTVMAAYTYLGQQNWHTNFGDMSMRAEMLNGVNIAPGMNFIYGRETWSVYATVQYFYNVLGYTGGRAGNDVDLPHMRMRHGFIQYGIGATKTWKDRFSGFLQIVIRNGGRTGIGFMGGITFKF